MSNCSKCSRLSTCQILTNISLITLASSYLKMWFIISPKQAWWPTLKIAFFETDTGGEHLGKVEKKWFDKFFF